MYFTSYATTNYKQINIFFSHNYSYIGQFRLQIIELNVIIEKHSNLNLIYCQRNIVHFSTQPTNILQRVDKT